MPMIENRELIARFNKMASVRCMIGMALEKRKALEHLHILQLSGRLTNIK